VRGPPLFFKETWKDTAGRARDAGGRHQSRSRADGVRQGARGQQRRERADAYTFDYHESDFYFGELRWLKLDIQTLTTKGTLLDKVDLTRVDEVGFVDLTPGSGHGLGGFSDVGWIEVYGKPVKRGS
jgi:hypothetical protein